MSNYIMAFILYRVGKLTLYNLSTQSLCRIPTASHNSMSSSDRLNKHSYDK